MADARFGAYDAPDDERHDCGRDHQRHEPSRDTVGDRLDRCTAALRLGNHLHNAREHRIAANRLRLHLEAAGAVDRPAGERARWFLFQTEERFDLEVHVLDSKRFKTGSGFFVNEADKPAKVLPTSASCYACHTTHGAVQRTFVQFYPTAKPISVKAGTFDKSK